MKEKIAIGIVLYNPDISLLKRNIDKYKSISSKIIFVDNGSSNINEIKEICVDCELVCNKKNLGIAKALNQLLDKAYELDEEYLLTLDQDSRITYDCVEKMFEYNYLDNVAIICPRINDLNKDKIVNIKGEYKYIDRCITSGSLMNLSLCKKIGYFDEKMFIDYVDFDYCKKVMLFGSKIAMIRDAILDHEVGKRTKRKFLFFSVYPMNYSNTARYYYFARNIRYYLHKYKGNLTILEYFHDIIHLFWKYINVWLYEDNKKEKLRMYRKGFVNYKLMNNI